MQRYRKQLRQPPQYENEWFRLEGQIGPNGRTHWAQNNGARLVICVERRILRAKEGRPDGRDETRRIVPSWRRERSTCNPGIPR